MSALFCLTVYKLKNRLTELARKPLKLIIVLGFIVLLVMNFSLSHNAPLGERPFGELKAIVFAFYILCFISETRKGFLSGGTMFSMADANLLFMSPVRSVAVLFHGMLGRLGSSLYMALAFVYQFALLRSYYPIESGGMLAFVLGYAAVLFLSQLTGMLVYFFTCGDSGKIKRTRLALYSVFAVFFLVAAIPFATTGHFSLTALADRLTGVPMRFFPVAGWVFTAVDGIMLSDGLKAAAGLIVCMLFAAAGFIILAFSKRGYYEDVLLSCDRNSDRKADDGVRADVKAVKTDGSLEKGSGASALYFKHRLENRRTKTSVLSPTSLFYLVLIGVYGFVFEGDFIMLFSFSCMVSFLPVLSGRWLKELTMPHIYLIPEPPIKKLFYIIPEMLPRILAESVLQCGLIAIVCGFGIGYVPWLILARISVSFVLIGSALVTARIFREKEKNSLFLALSVFPGIILTLPSAFICAMALNFGFGLFVSFALMAAVNLTVALVLLFSARNLLKITD